MLIIRSKQTEDLKRRLVTQEQESLVVAVERPTQPEPAPKAVMVLRPEQVTILDQACFRLYVDKLVAVLSGTPYRECLASLHPDRYFRDDVERFVLDAIEKAEIFGFDDENEVTPFVTMQACEELWRDSGEGAFIREIYEATELPAEERMDAIYEILDEELATLFFVDLKRERASWQEL